MGHGKRPELQGPAELYYNEKEAQKYTRNTRIISVQSDITKRAIELLNLPKDGIPKLLLDLGCGSGLSGEEITEAGHYWIGFDISPAMLDIAVNREVKGDICLADLGEGVPVREKCFDGAISISTIQWLCYSNSKVCDPIKRIKLFFKMLFNSLTSNGRAVIQIYPDSTEQTEKLLAMAQKQGFTGGLLIDYPNSAKLKKHYLVLMVSGMDTTPSVQLNDEMPAQLTMESDFEEIGDKVKVEKRRRNYNKKNKITKQRKIFMAKEKLKNRGRENIPHDSIYTGRKRKSKF